jgi:hypothetical protein
MAARLIRNNVCVREIPHHPERRRFCGFSLHATTGCEADHTRACGAADAQHIDGMIRRACNVLFNFRGVIHEAHQTIHCRCLCHVPVWCIGPSAG